MNRPFQYCDRLPAHSTRNCTECKRIQMAVYRGKTVEEAKGMNDPKQPRCRSCKVRFHVNPPAPNENYGPVRLHGNAIRWLENAARVFVAETDPGDQWTAEDFIAWVKPDLNGTLPPHPPEFVGLKKLEGGSRNGTMATRHASPDPLPTVPRSLRNLVS